MSITKTHENKVKDVIKTNHDGKFYNDHELSDTINTVINAVKPECDLDDETIKTIVIQ